ncbi:hypothetical protein Tco_1392864 [Tanacetum coccineum]
MRTRRSNYPNNSNVTIPRRRRRIPQDEAGHPGKTFKYFIKCPGGVWLDALDKVVIDGLDATLGSLLFLLRIILKRRQLFWMQTRNLAMGAPSHHFMKPQLILVLVDIDEVRLYVTPTIPYICVQYHYGQGNESNLEGKDKRSRLSLRDSSLSSWLIMAVRAIRMSISIRRIASVPYTRLNGVSLGNVR